MRTRRSRARVAEAFLERHGVTHDHLLGIRFAVNVFIATAIVWATLKALHAGNPIWAIASMVASSDPQPEEARRMFRSRLANVFVGCGVGSVFLLLGGRTDWLIPFALATSVLIATYVVRIKTMWRQTPITAAVVIAAGLAGSSTMTGIERGLQKVAEVIFGCVVGIVVSWTMSHVWLIRRRES